ncbi:SubName: Full=Uncharacterized protein {ECO:0000313/EMBL:CCA68320.1} [Serendipita indica DSM 11827]|uniref:U1-type domain-containing protein n=1 Tax=Serendipita indica (strain DSM 11827) TaxID=1109443 RepID=G4TAG8_SERID|nr:SubName: Full=Uncharacterized protein {ECO:0000313/EMBL:CCA68320.1} [Serendipita indica DSM 11827]CCA68320.1 hypothetical protein PIIN_02185 [Serendipita indica DSM 11827]
MAEQEKKAKTERKTWDKEEWRKKAQEKDAEERERMQKNDELMRKGKKPARRNPAMDKPKPTEVLKQREGSLELEKNLGKTMVVTNGTGRGAGQPGFYCEVCDRNHKDSNSYLDHLNSRSHLRMIGQSTRIERSTVEQVREKIAALRAQTKEVQTAKNFDFDRRLAEIRAKEDELRAERRAQKKAKKEAQRAELLKVGTDDVDMEAQADMAAMMGFSGFGTTKK